MMNWKKILVLSVLAAGVLGGGGYGLYRLFKKDESGGGTNTDSGSGSTTDSGTATTPTGTVKDAKNPSVDAEGSFPLMVGSKSKLVKSLQEALVNKYEAKNKDGSALVADGKFGENTAFAICDKVFKNCNVKITPYKLVKVERNLFNDIQKGLKRTDKVAAVMIPSKFSGSAPMSLSDIGL